MVFRHIPIHFVGLLLLIATPCAALADTAPQPPKLQLLFIGADPQSAAQGALPAELPSIAIDTLPEQAEAEQMIFAVRLRSSQISTFLSEPGETAAPSEQLFLITAVELLSDGAGYQIGLGAERFELDEFAGRVSAVVAAINPRNRRIGFLRVSDPADQFPLAIGPVRAALNSLGFDMLVVMIGGEAPASGCTEAQPQALAFAVVSGFADRTPFGNGDGISTSAEVETYLGRALSRQNARDPVCGPKYSLMIKSTSDPEQELVAYQGRSAFLQMETQLYNETFDAMFLLQSDDRDAVQQFLATCVYCPNERALTERLRDMQEAARISALEAEIWQRIKDDPAADRLAIYLANCALCVYRPEVEARMAEIDAKTRAAGAERAAFDAALAGRDVTALRDYVTGCIACENVALAEAEIAAIEADAAFQAEQASLAAALDTRDIAAMQAYLDSCTICTGREEVQTALAYETTWLKFARPCLDLAAVPQLGGPRKLEDIDRIKAQGTCEVAAREFPGNGLIQTTLGRIAQAAGDFDAAKAAYAAGMSANVPSAYGLAAYTHYAPPQGAEIDLVATELLAATGAKLGDWLSQEILTVLYSKELIPGKTPEDAFRVAKDTADEGNPLAQFFVGYYYLTGTGVAPSEADAAAWFAKSVDQGYTHAYAFLADLHEQGAGAELSPEKAAELYWDALQAGDPTAADRLTTQLRDRDREVVRIIQQKLRDAGVYRGSADGVPGRGTVSAIERFATDLTAQN